MTRHEHPASHLIVQTITRLRDTLFHLDGARLSATDDIYDRVHRCAHEAERLAERWAAVLGESVDPRPIDVRFPSRGYGLVVANRVGLVRLRLSDAAMCFVASLDPDHECEHVAPLVVQTRELLVDVRVLDEERLETLEAVAYVHECDALGLAELLDAAAPDFARDIDACDLEVLDALRDERVPASFVRDARGNRPYLSTDELVDVLDSFMRRE